MLSLELRLNIALIRRISHQLHGKRQTNFCMFLFSPSLKTQIIHFVALVNQVRIEKTISKVHSTTIR